MATAAPSSAPAITSSTTCWRVASVEYRMAPHHSQFSACQARPQAISASKRASQIAVNTANATCSEGQALALTSTRLRNATDGWADQSIANSGTAVGQSMNAPRPNTASASEAKPKDSKSRPLPIKAGASETYSHSDR